MCGSGDRAGGGWAWAKQEGKPMRNIFTVVAGLAFVGAASAHAQEAVPQQPPAQPPAATPDAAPQIKRFEVVDVSELPQATQKHVEQVVAQASGDTLKQLRFTIESTPQAKAALDAKGMTAEQVVATAMSSDGTLTLITKKKS